jgi:site-specific recombinase XerD
VLKLEKDQVVGADEIIISGKGDKQRVIEVIKPLKEKIDEYLSWKKKTIYKFSPYLFSSNRKGKRNRPLDRKTVWHMIRSLTNEAEIKKILIHTGIALRHGY